MVGKEMMSLQDQICYPGCVDTYAFLISSGEALRDTPRMS